MSRNLAFCRTALGVAEAAARAAGRALREAGARGWRRLEYKGAFNPVTEGDRQAEAIILEALRKAFPAHGLLSEESGETAAASEYRWIVDPIDGTANFARGLPWWAVSIALQHRDGLVAGVVYNPALDDLFTAVAGEGAWRNGVPVRVSTTAELHAGIIAAGFRDPGRRVHRDRLDQVAAVAGRTLDLRRLGSAAYELCCVAAGILDGFFESCLNPWDVAAGALVVQEAGGRLSTHAGEPYHPDAPDLVATNGLLHDELVRVLAAARTASP